MGVAGKCALTKSFIITTLMSGLFNYMRSRFTLEYMYVSAGSLILLYVQFQVLIYVVYEFHSQTPLEAFQNHMPVRIVELLHPTHLQTYHPMKRNINR